MAKNSERDCSLIRKVKGVHSGTDHINLSYQSTFTLMKNVLCRFIYTPSLKMCDLGEMSCQEYRILNLLT